MPRLYREKDFKDGAGGCIQKEEAGTESSEEVELCRILKCASIYIII